jgi:hypothetical protein
MAGRVVGVPHLTLEGEEDADPTILVREVQQQSAVLPHAVVPGEGAAVALVHVDVVDAVAGSEAEYLVGLVRLRRPPFPEGVDHRLRLGDRPPHPVVQEVSKVVVGTRHVGREHAHSVAVADVAADEVQVRGAGTWGQPGEPKVRGHGRGQRMAQVVVDVVQELEGCSWERTFTARRKRRPFASTASTW